MTETASVSACFLVSQAHIGFTESEPGTAGAGEGVSWEGDHSMKDHLSFIITLVLLAAEAS